MIVFPAIDLLEGRTVNLVQGDFDRGTVYETDPVAQARAFAAEGAEWIHVVDLDAARGSGNNHEVIAAICAAISVPVQVGGGVRDGSLFEIGVRRVILGSLLLQDRLRAAALLEVHPGMVAVGLDHRQGRLRTAAWAKDSELSLTEVLCWPEVAGAAAAVVTAIEADGMLDGPGVSEIAELVGACPVPFIASGGVATLDDLLALRSADVTGVVIGRALYEGRFTLKEAISAASG